MAAGKITALQAQASDTQRVNVFVDGQYAIGISLTTLARERLFVGQELDEEAYARLEAAEQSDKAMHAALRALESRPRSTAELRSRLIRKGFLPEQADAALVRLGDLGLVDDEAFARYWVEARQRGRPRGTAALRQELRQKGVGKAVIEETLGDGELVGDQEAQAERLARTALRKYAGAASYAEFARRLGGYLQRRGFALDTIRPLVSTLWREVGQARDAEGDDEDDEPVVE